MMRLVGWPLVAVSVDDALMADELELAFTVMAVVDSMISETVVMSLVPFNFVLTVHNMVTMVSLAHMLTIVQVGVEVALLLEGVEALEISHGVLCQPALQRVMVQA